MLNFLAILLHVKMSMRELEVKIRLCTHYLFSNTHFFANVIKEIDLVYFDR